MPSSLHLHVPGHDPPAAKQRRRQLPGYLRDEEIAAIFDAARSLWESTTQPRWRIARQRDWLMVQVAYYCGLRVAELCALNVEDIDLAGRLLIVRHGKGDADGAVPLSSKLLPVLTEWIGERTSGVLFPDPRGRHVHTRQFRSRLRLLAKLAGISRRCNPHLLRHTYAVHLLRRGVSKGITIYDVQHLMRHRDIRTTAIYLHLVPGKLIEAVDLL